VGRACAARRGTAKCHLMDIPEHADRRFRGQADHQFRDHANAHRTLWNDFGLKCILSSLAHPNDAP
jgi:hypothetical protein